MSVLLVCMLVLIVIYNLSYMYMLFVIHIYAMLLLFIVTHFF